MNKGHVPLVGILALTFLLGRLGLESKSFWIDEAVTAGIVRSSWSELWSLLTTKEPFMAPYHLLLFPWAKLGTSEAWIRGFSVCFAVATVGFQYALARRLYSHQIGLLAAFLLSINAYFITYAQEARAYSLLLFFVVGAVYYMVRTVDSATSRSAWPGLVGFGSLAVNTHIFAGLVLLAGFVSVAFLRPGRVSFRAWTATAICIAFASPFALLCIRSAADVSWIPSPSLLDIIDFFSSLAGEGGPPLLLFYTGLGWFFLRELRSEWKRDHRSRNVWAGTLALLWLVLPVAIVSLYSVVTPIFVKRYLIVCLPALTIIGAVGLAALRSRWIFRSGLVMVVIGSAVGLGNWYLNGKKEEWRDATHHIVAESESGDAVACFAYFMDYGYRYYATEIGSSSPPVVDISSGPYWIGATLPDPDYERLRTLDREFGRLWLVLSHDTSLGRRDQRDEMLTVLSNRYPKIDDRSWYKVRVLLFDLRPDG